MTTSVVASPICARFVRTSGQASESVEAASAAHAPRGTGFSPAILLMARASILPD